MRKRVVLMLVICGLLAWGLWGWLRGPGLAPEPVITESGNGSRSLGRRGSGTSRVEGPGELAYNARHALVVGINNYRRSDAFSDLTGAGFDAAEVASVLATRFGFEHVTLLIDGEPGFPVPADGVRTVTASAITGDVLRTQLADLSEQVGPHDGLLFYFAGHGMPDWLVPADGNPDREATMVALTDVVRDLRRCDAHHTLMVLDSCFSGSVLEADSGAVDIVGDLDTRRLRRGTGDNFSRVFNRRAFQVITAGTGTEEVGDNLLKAAKAYAGLDRRDQGHSPFTAVLLQALQGRVGRPDGKLAASDLGFHMHRTLVNVLKEARQAPKHGRLGMGDGDFVFLPLGKVLNPELIAPLYQEGDEYAELRAAACRSLLTRDEMQSSELVRSCLPHVGRLLRDPAPLVRLAAARLIARLAGIHKETVTGFAQHVASLVNLIPARRDPWEDKVTADTAEAAARALGQLAGYATPEVVERLLIYVRRRVELWAKTIRGRQTLPWLQQVVEQTPIPDLSAHADMQGRVAALDRVRQAYSSLFIDGLRSVERLEIDAGISQRIDLAFDSDNTMEALALLAGGTTARERAAALRVPPPTAWPLALLTRSTQDVTPDGAGGRALVVYSLAYSPDGAFVLTGSGNGYLRLWNASNHQLLATARVGADPVRAIAFHPNSPIAAVDRSDGVIGLWDLDSREFTATIDGHTRSVDALAFSPDGRLLASASSDRTVRLVDLEHREPRAVLEFSRAPQAFAWSPDGSLFAVACNTDPQVRLFRTSDGQLLGATKPEAGTGNPGGLAFASGGQRIVYITLAGVFSFEVEPVLTGQAAPIQQIGEGRAFRMAHSPDSPWFATTGEGPVRVYDSATLELHAVLPTVDDAFPVSFGPDGRLAVGILGIGVQLWQIAPLADRLSFSGHDKAVLRMAISPDGRWIASGDLRQELRLWDLTAVEPEIVIARPAPRGRIPGLVEFLSDDLLVVGRGNRLRYWSRQSRAFTGPSFDGEAGSYLVGLAISADRSVVSSGWVSQGRETCVRLHDAETLVCTGTLASGPIVAFDPCSNLLATGGEGVIQLWDVDKQKIVGTLEGHSDRVLSLAFSPDGTMLASAADDEGSIRLWFVPRSLPLAVFQCGPHIDVNGLAFSPDGSVVAAALGSEGLVLLDTENLLNALYRFFPAHGRSRTASAAFSPDGRLLTVGYEDGEISVLGGVVPADPVAGQRLTMLKRHGTDLRPLTPQEFRDALERYPDVDRRQPPDPAAALYWRAYARYSRAVVMRDLARLEHDVTAQVPAHDIAPLKAWVAAHPDHPLVDHARNAIKENRRRDRESE